MKLPMTPLAQRRWSRRRLATLGVLGVGSLYALAMLWARWAYVGHTGFRFLSWNLFLAWLPLVFALWLDERERRGAGRLMLVGVTMAWLAFWPNAPYILTDFVHLAGRSPNVPVPLWYDIVLIAVFAWNGLLLGFASLAIFHRVATRRFGAARGWGFVALASLLGGFGIYLGRFERWNTWDVLARPTELLASVVMPVVNPIAHPKVWGVTLSIGGFLFLSYAALAVLRPLPVRCCTAGGVGDR